MNRFAWLTGIVALSLGSAGCPSSGTTEDTGVGADMGVGEDGGGETDAPTIDAPEGSDARVGSDGGSDAPIATDAPLDAQSGDCGGDTCGRDEYCNYRTGCGGAGTCELRPDICPGIYAPVCGCDGITYSNDCDAAASGVSVESDGECATTERCVPACAADETCELCRGGAYACIPRGSAC